jgi:hypothetical protein
MDTKDGKLALLEGDMCIQTANSCEDYIGECGTCHQKSLFIHTPENMSSVLQLLNIDFFSLGLPSSHITGEVEYQIESYTHASSLSEAQKQQLFDIFEVNMRDYYEQNWGWDKKMKWYDFI